MANLRMDYSKSWVPGFILKSYGQGPGSGRAQGHIRDNLRFAMLCPVRPVKGFKETPHSRCATMVKFQYIRTSLPIPPSSTKKTSSGVNFPVLLHFASKKKTYTSKLALRIFFSEKTLQKVPKNRSKLTIEKNQPSIPSVPPIRPPNMQNHC